MTRSEYKRWHEIFQENLEAAIEQLTWIKESPNDRVLANRIGVCVTTKEFVLDHIMPSGLRTALNKKYPNCIERF